MSQPESPKPVKHIATATEMLEKRSQTSYAGSAMKRLHMRETVGITSQNLKPAAESRVTKLKRIFSNMKYANTTSPASQPLRPKSLTEENSGGCGTDEG